MAAAFVLIEGAGGAVGGERTAAGDLGGEFEGRGGRGGEVGDLGVELLVDGRCRLAGRGECEGAVLDLKVVGGRGC